MGKSASGKDTILKVLKDDTDFQFRSIVPYTTRPMRSGEQNGVEYFFISEEQFQDYKQSGNILEYRSYNTMQGIWRYCTIYDDQFKCDDKDLIMICTLESYRELKQKFSSYNIIPIYICVDDGERLYRAVTREIDQKHPKYEELCRRFLQDQIDFSDDKLELCGIHKRFTNDNFARCMKDIKEYLKCQM